MYSARDGNRQPVTAGGEGDRLLLGQVAVGPAPRPPSAAELGIPHPLAVEFGPIRLIGYGLTLAGQDAERTAFAPGDVADLTLFWEAESQPPSAASFSLQLAGQTLAHGPLVPQFTTLSWHAEDRFRDQHRLTLPSGIHGSQDLVLAIGGQRSSVAQLRVG